MKKYLLFVWYSVIGTIADWTLLIFLSLIIKGIALVTMIATLNFDMEYFKMFVRHGCAASNVVSYAIGVAITFVLSAKYAFKLNDNMGRRIRNTTVIHIVGLLVQSGLFAMLIHHRGYDENTAKIITICENAVLMGAGNIFIVFRNYKKDNSTKKQKKVSETWAFSSAIYGYFFTNDKIYIERSFFICLIPSSRNHVTLPM